MIDEAQKALHAAGWSVGDVCFRFDNKPQWLVYVHRGDKSVVANAPRQADAWQEAVRLVQGLAREE